MSGIVGSRLNNRGSGLVGSLGTDGQVLTSSGAGTSAVYEAAAGGMSVSDITGATALTTEPELADEIVLSDAGTLKRLDYQHMTNVGKFAAYDNQFIIEHATNTAVDGFTEDLDIEGWFSSNAYTPQEPGYYFFNAGAKTASSAMNRFTCNIYLNGGVLPLGNLNKTVPFCSRTLL